MFNFFLFSALGGLVVWILYRRYWNFDKILIKDLQKYGLVFKESKSVPFFSKSPFKRVELYNFHYSTNILGLRGEEIFYRIVTFENKSEEVKLWVQINTRAFRIYSVKWEKDLNNY